MIKKLFMTTLVLFLASCTNSQLIKEENTKFLGTSFKNNITLYRNQSTSSPRLFETKNTAKSSDQYVVYIDATSSFSNHDIQAIVRHFNDYSRQEMEKICTPNKPRRISGPTLNGNMNLNNTNPLANSPIGYAFSPLVDDSIGYIYECTI